jgi:hypothetical protein
MISSKEVMLEGDDILADFMEYPDDNQTLKGKRNLLRYHFSWDWLMLVYEKINTMDKGVYHFEIRHLSGFIHSEKVDFTLPGQPHRYNFQASAPTTHEAVWLTAVEFAKWYKIKKDEQ